MYQLLSDSNLTIINFLKSPETAVSNFYQILNQREMSQTSPASSCFLNTLTFLFFKSFFRLMTYDYCVTADRKESDGSQFFTQFFMSSQTRQIILGIAEPTQHQWS